ncbi:MAG: hypothetical protein H7X80_08000 [bacterium]|nr:hypothetical protein [Candidatus Kapabacteria bacterium]
MIYILTAPMLYTIGDPNHELGYAVADTTTIRANHLISSPVNKVVVDLLQVRDDRVAAMITLEALFIVASLITGWCIVRIARELGADIVSATVMMLWVLLSNAFWLHATTVESGAIPTTLLAASVLFAIDSKQSFARSITSGALFALSVLFNFQHVLLSPAALLLFRNGGAPVTTKRRNALIALGAMAFVGLLAYGVVAWPASGVRSLSEFITWITTNSEQKYISHLSIGFDSILRSISGLISLTINTHGGTSAVKVLMQRRPDVASGIGVMIYLGVGLVCTAVLCLLAWIGRREQRAFALAAFVAFLITLLFGMYWLGSDPQFWLPLVPFIAPLAAVGLSAIRKRSPKVIGIAGAVLCLAFIIINAPIHEPSIVASKGDAVNAHAMSAAAELPKGTLLITPGSRWSAVLTTLRTDIDAIDLVRDSTHGLGTDSLTSLAAIDASVSRALASNRNVVVEGIDGSIPLEQVGNWEIISNVRMVSREDIREGLQRKFSLHSIPATSGVRITSIRAR